MSDTRNVIVRLLRNLGSRNEVEQYLKEFSSIDSRKFAVIKVGGGILQDDLESLASSLSFLHQVGLFPIVVHGAGPQLNAALEEEGIESKRVDGMRVTDQKTLEVARRVFLRENLKLVEALEELGTRARPLTSGVFEATLMDEERYGLVGEIASVNLEPIRSCIRARCLPILASLGETSSGQIVNINADVAARQLSIEGEPYKVIFLTPTGGILDGDEQIIPSINLAEDFEYLMEQPWVHSGMRVKLEQIEHLLGQLPLSSSVSITTPDHLARELFTHRGSGTLIRRGERILAFDDFDSEGFDLERARALVEQSFGRALDDDYFSKKNCHKVYVSENYRAVAILTHDGVVPYLDKFAVTPRAQGEGLGRSIWLRMRHDNPSLFWRSRSSNPINNWYFQQAEGSYTQHPWTVFWYGIERFEQMRDCVAQALAMPATLAEPM
jgi:acetylglutamate kinase